MNTPSGAMTESLPGSEAVAPAEIPASRRMYWALRRELWENRSIYLAPLGVAGVVLCGFLLTLARLPEKLHAASTLAPIERQKMIEEPFDGAAALIMLTFLIVAAFYCVDALYGERRDRSILFWKSLPVSDFTAVAAKASVPFAVLPLLVVLTTVVTQFIMLLLSSAVVGASGESVALLWNQLSPFRMFWLLLYHIFTAHVLWAAPLYAWLLLVSAWAKRAPFLWAVLPPLAIAVFEKMLFNTSHFASLLFSRFSGGGMEAVTAPGTMPMNPMTHLTPAAFLGSMGLWIGLAVAAAFLAAAVRLRRYRGPI
jgi:ABC-2 type transport system permease protein